MFGDTVNTASRMESNGEKGRIHCSGDTAKLLPQAWLSLREDKIIAKGKGEMTTYFISNGTRAKSFADTSVAFTDGDFIGTSDEGDDDLDFSALAESAPQNAPGGSLPTAQSSPDEYRRFSEHFRRSLGPFDSEISC